MLEIAPKRWYSRDFTVAEEGRARADVDLHWWRERGRLRLDGVDYAVYRERLFGGDFVLDSGGIVLARATKRSALRSTMRITFDGRQYTLQRRSTLRRAMVLLDGGREIGSLAPAGILTRRATAQLPGDWPAPVTMFIVWLTLLLWNREAAAAAS